MSGDRKRPREDVRVWFETVHGGLVGSINLRAIYPDRSGPTVSEMVRTIDEAVDWCAKREGQGANLYAGLARRGNALNDRGDIDASEKNLGACQVVWADLDSGTREEQQRRIAGIQLKPTLIVNSGGGLHAIWKLDEPIEAASDPEANARLRRVLRGVQSAIGGDPSVTDPSRIFRVAGTVNYPDEGKRKRGRTEVRSEILERSQYTVVLDDFSDLELRGEAEQQRDGAEARANAGGGTVPSGERHPAMRVLAGRLRRDGFGARAMEAAMLLENEERFDPPLPVHEVRDLARWTAEKHPPGGSIDGFEVAAAAAPTDPPAVRALSAEEWLNDEPPAATVEGLVFEGSTTNLVGAAKAGKTYLALQMAACIVAGVPFLGLAVRQARVIYFSLELSAAMLRDRLDAIAADTGTPTVSVGDRFTVLAPTRKGATPALDLSTTEGRQRLDDLIKETGAEVVFLDTLYRFLPGRDFNSNTEMGQDFGELNALAQRTGAAIVMLDHRPKMAAEGSTVSQSALGAQIKGGAVRTIAALSTVTRGKSWKLDVESHFGNWDEPITYRRPVREDGSPGMGAELTTQTEARGLTSENLEELFRKHGEQDAMGRFCIPSKRKLIKALEEEGYSKGNDQGPAVVGSILKDYCHRRGVLRTVDRPIEVSDGPRNAVVFTWRFSEREVA